MAPIRPPLHSVNERIAVLERALEEHDNAFGQLAREVAEVRDAVADTNTGIARLEATLDPLVRRLERDSQHPPNRQSSMQLAGIIGVCTILAHCVELLVRAVLHLG